MTLSLILLAILFSLSAFFSASETALFSLRREDRNWLAGRDTTPSRCVTNLLQSPRSLLVAVLFGNLIVNFLLFAVSARLLLEFTKGDALLVVGGGLLTTTIVLVAGEVLPKAIALRLPRRVSLISGPPLLAFRNATRWVTNPLSRLVTAFLDLIEARMPDPSGELTDRELRRFVELQHQDGSLERQASEFLAAALERGSMRAHEIVTHRVDLVAVEENSDREAFMDLVQVHRLGKILVHKGDADRIHGFVRTKDLVLRPETSPKELVQPIWFVPGTKTVESLLREMIERGEQLALVLDEYGGTVGLVTLEDLVEEITGDLAREHAFPLARAGDEPGAWVLSGRFPLREAGELLGVHFEPGPTTLSGFVSQQLGRLPEKGDIVWRARIQFRVRSVEKRRANEVVVYLPSYHGVAHGMGSNDVSQALTRSGAQRADQRLSQWVSDAQPDSDSDAGAVS